MLTALYCVTMINQLFQGRACTKHNFSQTLKLQSAVVTMKNSFLSPNNVSMQVGAEKLTGSEDRAQEMLN